MGTFLLGNACGLLGLALCCLLFAFQAPAAPPDKLAADKLDALRSQVTAMFDEQSQVKSVSQVSLSPDGTRVAWAVDGPRGGTHEIYVAGVRNAAASTRITAASNSGAWCSDQEPAWSNDSKQLAFLSDCASPGQSQVFVEDVTGHHASKPMQVTHLSGFLSHPQWSPRGEAIALLFVDKATRAPTPMAAENKAVGVIDDLKNTDIQRLVVAHARSGRTRFVTPANLYVFEYDWAPDGKKFAFTAALPPGDDNWYIAQLYTQPEGSSQPTLVYKPQWQIALPRWSPDGKSIAYIEGLMSDQGATGGEIYTIPESGGQARNLTPGWTSTPTWFSWLSTNEMALSEFSGGSTSIGTLDVRSGGTKRLWLAGETIRAGAEESSVSLSNRDGLEETALIRTSWSTLPEVWVGPVGKWSQFTRVNSAVQSTPIRFDDVTWKNEGFDVQGWLLYPRNYDAGKHYPMLTVVHGGPAWIATPTWRSPDFNSTLFTNFGYFVFFPNARGSYGHGEKFTQANRRDWGFGDLRDILAGVSTIEQRYPINDKRIGLLGWSYGGSMAMIGITQTNLFRAAVAGAGAANWQSYYGQNSIDKWMIPYFGASAYDDPAAYARCSAMTYIRSAKTPTLVVVGERDGECPAPQSIEFWHALKELGVPTQLVIYADEGHSFFKQEDRIDVTARTLDWFNRHMPAE